MSAVMSASLARPVASGAWTMATRTTAALSKSSSVTASILSRRLPGTGAAQSSVSGQRFLSMLPQLRPTTTPGRAVFRPAPTPSVTATVSSSLDLVAVDSISRHPALAGLANQMRCGPRATMERTSRLIQKRRCGFLSRVRSKSGRKTLARRRAKGRKRLTY